MTIHRDGRNKYLECEECPETTEAYGRDDFDVLVATAKDAGWKIVPDGATYLHYCPNCGETGSRLARAQALFR